MLEEIQLTIQSSIPLCISAPSSDESSSLDLLSDVAKQLELPMYVWSLDHGFRAGVKNDRGELVLVPLNSQSLPLTHSLPSWRPSEGLTWRDHSVGDAVKFLEQGPRGLFVYIDLHEYLDQPQLRRLVKSTVPLIGGFSDTAFVMLGHDVCLPPDLQGMIELIEIPLADEAQRLKEITALYPSLIEYGAAVPGVGDSCWPELLNSAATLSKAQIGHGVAKAVQRYGCLDGRASQVFHELKISNLRRLGVTVSEPPDTDIGGLRLLREWIDRRAPLFASDALYVPRAKGVVLVGFAGTGKSLAARIIGQSLRIPVFKLEADQLLGSLVGESERKTKEVLGAIEKAAPGVLWIDEIEKIFSGAGSGGSSDSGVGDRILGQVLTFLQEHRSKIFVVATANNIKNLPPELTRKGRFDEVFFIDLPNSRDRAEVLKIHLTRWCDRSLVDAALVAEMSEVISEVSEGWSGAELAQLVTEAATYAASDGRPGAIVVNDLQTAFGSMRPLSATDPEAFDAIRSACRGFTRATEAEPTAGANTRSRSFR